ncbi:MAG: hypothetical protein AAF570_05700, partial [Bacteroidota bacterium]
MGALKNLHQLLQTLDRSEKRYFRLQRAAHGKADGQTEQLFDLLQSSDATTLIENDFEGHPGIATNLPTLTRRLFAGLSAALTQLHSGKTTESRLHHALETIALLYRKKQWNLAAHEVRKAKRLARKFTFLPQLLSLISFERKLILATSASDGVTQMEVLREEEIRAQALLQQQNELQHLEHLIRHLIRQRSRSSADISMQQLEALATNPVVEAALTSEDLRLFSYATNIRGNFLNITQNFAAAAGHYRLAFDKWKNAPEWVREHPDFFLSLFSNYQIALLHSLEDPTELEEALLFLRTVRLTDPATRLIFQNMSFQSTNVVYLNRGKFEEAITLFDEISGWLKKNKGQISNSIHLIFHYNAA